MNMAALLLQTLAILLVTCKSQIAEYSQEDVDIAM